MIYIVSIITYVVIGFILAIVWALFDWADISDGFMPMAFMVGWPLIVFITFITAIFVPFGKALSRLGEKIVRILKRWSKK